jgi:hypothetical protein
MRSLRLVLDKKSKQKNQAKIIPAFAHKAHKPGAIFAGHRALLFLNFEISHLKFLPDNIDFLFQN